MRLILILALLFNTTVFIASANGKDGETRKATVTKPFKPGMALFVKAKHTELEIEAWDKPEIFIEATVRFDGKMTNKMEEFLAAFQQEVEKNIKVSGNDIQIDTNLEEPNKVQIGTKNVGIIMGFSENELKITYNIKAPTAGPIEIDHSYRDLNLIGHFEELRLSQYSGDFIAESIGKANLKMKYGSARVKKIEIAAMELYEQEINVEDFGEVELSAKYSDLEFERINRMSVEAYESDFELGTVGTFTGNLKYGDIKIQNELESGKLELYEMDLEGRLIGDLTLTNSKYSNFNFDSVESIHFDQSYEDEIEIDKLIKLSSLNSKYAKFDIGTLGHSFKIQAYEADVYLRSISNEASKVQLEGKYIKTKFFELPSSFILLAETKYGKINYDESRLTMKKYIKDSDKLEIEAYSKMKNQNPCEIIVNGYEIDIDLN